MSKVDQLRGTVKEIKPYWTGWRQGTDGRRNKSGRLPTWPSPGREKGCSFPGATEQPRGPMPMWALCRLH